MKLNHVRIFDISLDNAKVADLKGVEIVDGALIKKGEPVDIEGYGVVDLSNKSVHLQPLDGESAKVFYAPKKRGKETHKKATLVEAVKRILDGEKVSIVSFDTRISGVYLRKLTRGDVRPEVLAEATSA